MDFSLIARWTCGLTLILCLTVDSALAQRQPGGGPTSPPANGGTPPGTGGQTPNNGNGGEVPGNGNQGPGNGSEEPGNGGEEPDNEAPDEDSGELSLFEELICQFIAEDIMFGDQEFGLLLYYIFAAEDEARSNRVMEIVSELFEMDSEPPGPAD